MTVSQGGTVIASTPLNGGNSDAAIAVGRFFSDATLTITDPGSSVTANGDMYVGHGGTGTLIVENFGNLTAGATEGGVAGGLGIGSGSTGSGTSRGGTGTATVTSGGTIDDLGAMTIGGTGVDGSLGVSDGGKVIATDHIRLGTGATVDGTYYFGAGTLDVNAGGTVEVLGAGPSRHRRASRSAIRRSAPARSRSRGPARWSISAAIPSTWGITAPR